MGWWSDLKEKRKENAAFLENLKKEKNGTEFTFNHEYPSNLLSDAWGENAPCIVKLYENLLDGEHLERLVLSTLGTQRNMAIGLTNMRFISYYKLGTTGFDAKWEDLRSAQQGSWKGDIKISTRHNDEAFKIKWGIVDPSLKDDFIGYFNQQMQKASEEGKEPLNIIQTTSDDDELAKYAELKEQGVITQEEFDAKKKQILGLV